MKGKAIAGLVLGILGLVLSFIGVWIGNRFGLKYHRAATIFGGVVLILIGIKILMEALGILPGFLRCDLVSVEQLLHTLLV